MDDLSMDASNSSTIHCDENEDSDEWDEMETTAEQTSCLFCDEVFLTIAVALDHCRTAHNFDLLELKTRFQMDCYSYIKMINYIRKNRSAAEDIMKGSSSMWDSDEYLKPGEMENWLMYDFDDLGTAPSTPHYAIDGKAPISNINYSDLQRKINLLECQLREKCLLLDNANRDIAQMKQVTKTILEGSDNDVPMPTTCNLRGDSDYFQSYSHFGIHHEMLNDQVRTTSYRDAFFHNMDSFKDKLVLDVGCGTGILSMFAAKAGAKKVYGIDQSEVLYKAMDVVRENNLQDQIHLMRDQIEKVGLPVEKVDFIVSEWMGYFLLFEGMLDSVLYARDKFLAPNGRLLPNRCNISLVGISDLDTYKKYIGFWDNVYGFSMKCMKSEVLQEAFVDTVPKEKIITKPQVLKELDLETCDRYACNFTSNFELEICEDGALTALVGYFDIFFDLPNPIIFSTSPKTERTHWQQTIFYLKDVIKVNKGDTLKGSLSCTKARSDVRGLQIVITLGQSRHEYHMS
ncbi:protein arginine N-methyltransferase 1 [Coccinella septempunctata]|uniref:protein arginine N-methyltransferase 1 n=1 Tax=Coccinella septempunctata TaxID=41139 RepID=UPI001D06EC79|nr:protein arginine N-methyltransferase 1 [Coccinella septempunctata]